MKPRNLLDIATALLIASGLCLHGNVAIANLSSPIDIPFSVALLAWSISPYAIAALIHGRFRMPYQAVGWLVTTFLADASMYVVVFVHPRGSTAALGLLFMPLCNLILLGPSGAIVGWAVRAVLSRYSRPSVNHR